MVGRGRVQNGVVVLANGVRLPEGQEVTILAHATVPRAAHRRLAVAQRPRHCDGERGLE
jgi:hypothetical protein